MIITIKMIINDTWYIILQYNNSSSMILVNEHVNMIYNKLNPKIDVIIKCSDINVIKKHNELHPTYEKIKKEYEEVNKLFVANKIKKFILKGLLSYDSDLIKHINSIEINVWKDAWITFKNIYDIEYKISDCNQLKTDSSRKTSDCNQLKTDSSRKTSDCNQLKTDSSRKTLSDDVTIHYSCSAENHHGYLYVMSDYYTFDVKLPLHELKDLSFDITADRDICWTEADVKLIIAEEFIVNELDSDHLYNIVMSVIVMKLMIYYKEGTSWTCGDFIVYDILPYFHKLINKESREAGLRFLNIIKDVSKNLDINLLPFRDIKTMIQ
jgi:hypothetical protein